MLDLLSLPTSRRDWAILISILSVLAAAGAVGFGHFTPRSLIGAGIFIAAAALSILAVRPRRTIGVPMTVVSALLPFVAIYVLVAPQLH